MTEAEKDEFATALSERYAEIKQSSSSEKLLNTWDEVINDLPSDIKAKFDERNSQLQYS
ncbi:hypothetical protein [Paenibacillus amylolyticus]|uniref:hypothetical protein n=1 Tax=Paenibacillus amylolyticus TaxID=1451 RepID=UPI001374EFA7|nr:hypothetical protein [Paenibacillus amylolyticus]